jgi:hypothetical protein
MKTRAVLSIAAAIALVGCSDFRNSVESEASPPKQQSVTVNYTGPDGFKLAVGKANDWCDKHLGRSDVRLLQDDRAAGRAVFACVPL